MCLRIYVSVYGRSVNEMSVYGNFWACEYVYVYCVWRLVMVRCEHLEMELVYLGKFFRKPAGRSAAINEQFRNSWRYQSGG